MNSDVVSVRPRALRATALAGLFLVPAAFRAFVNGGVLERWIFVGGAVMLLAVFVSVRFGFGVTVTPDTVTVRQPLRTVSFNLDRLRSVSGRIPGSGRKPGVESLTFEGADGTRTSLGMTFFSCPDRVRLLAVLTERTAPDVVRWDAPMRAMLAGGRPDTPPGSGSQEAAGPRSGA
ncbi:hypothetical protein [Streptomyces sp. NBC_00102]|uniref:hypothetical protein n=1 Tax=Streptomyces sp. NBC_00102 TaxID=2975652 RepID=UPI00225C01D1|nr:hypothetical protein [Streptomyces sp. NBC_00102]MCX5398851.1 hypothetical protein [Streptomyces sp. NBC_00102]